MKLIKMYKSVVFIFLICSLISIFSCKKKDERSSSAAIESVTIIVNNLSNAPLFIRRNIALKDIGKKQDMISTSKQLDTLTVPTDSYEYYYISNPNSPISTIFIGRKDSVIIKIDTLYNITTKLIRSESYIDKNINDLERNQALLSGEEYIDSLSNIYYRADSTGIPLKLQGDFDQLISYPIIVEREKILSDSIEIKKLIKFILANYENTVKVIKNSRLTENIEQTIIYKVQFDLFNRLIDLDSYVNTAETKNILKSNIFINSNLPENPFGKNILNYFMSNFIINEKPDYSRSRIYLNYFQAFNDAPKYLDSSLVKYARYLSFDMMSTYGESIKNMNAAFTHFKDVYKDTLLNSTLEKRYLFDFKEINKKTDNVYLIDKTAQLSDLNKVLHKHKGNVVYVDFWASWCGPCRKAIPFSHKLRKEFQNKNLVVIYLSIDDNREKWSKATVLDGLDYYNESYLVVNPKQSQFLNEISLTEIPRYLLFDKDGKLLHQDAPGPSSREIKKLILENL